MFRLVLNPSEHFLTKNPYEHVKQTQVNTRTDADISHYISQYIIFLKFIGSSLK